MSVVGGESDCDSFSLVHHPLNLHGHDTTATATAAEEEAAGRAGSSGIRRGDNGSVEVFLMFECCAVDSEACSGQSQLRCVKLTPGQQDPHMIGAIARSRCDGPGTSRKLMIRQLPTLDRFGSWPQRRKSRSSPGCRTHLKRAQPSHHPHHEDALDRLTAHLIAALPIVRIAMDGTRLPSGPAAAIRTLLLHHPSAG